MLNAIFARARFGQPDRAHAARGVSIFAKVRVVGCAIGGVSLLVAGCGGGGGAHASGSRVSYCQAFARDWPTLVAAGLKAQDANANLNDPLGDPAEVSQQLIADKSTYLAAAGAAATLARSAPTKLKNDVTTDIVNAKQRLFDLSAALTALAHGDTHQVDAVDMSAYDAAGTGCTFAIGGGPNGTVATEYWP